MSLIKGVSAVYSVDPQPFSLWGSSKMKIRVVNNASLPISISFYENMLEEDAFTSEAKTDIHLSGDAGLASNQLGEVRVGGGQVTSNSKQGHKVVHRGWSLVTLGVHEFQFATSSLHLALSASWYDVVCGWNHVCIQKKVHHLFVVTFVDALVPPNVGPGFPAHFSVLPRSMSQRFLKSSTNPAHSTRRGHLHCGPCVLTSL